MRNNVQICLVVWRQLGTLGLDTKKVDMLRMLLHNSINNYGCANVANALAYNYKRVMKAFDRLTYYADEKPHYYGFFVELYSLDFASILNEAEHGV